MSKNKIKEEDNSVHDSFISALDCIECVCEAGRGGACILYETNEYVCVCVACGVF